MIDALIQGKLYGQPSERASKTGAQFVTAKVRAAAGDGEGLFVSVIAFSRGACAALLALDDGDPVALAARYLGRAWHRRWARTQTRAHVRARPDLSAKDQRRPHS